MHSAQTPTDAARWAALVAALSGHVEDMTLDFARRVRQIPDYGAGLVPPAEVVDTAQRTFAMLVEGLQEGAAEADSRMLEYAADLGAKRARAGIPPSSLTTAVRLDFSIIWRQLLDLAQAHDGALLASRVEQVWRLVDEYALRTFESYQAERVRMAHEESSVQREFLALLFGPEQLSAESLARAGAALGLNPAAELVLAAGEGKAGAAIRVLGGTPGRFRTHVYEAGSIVYGFWVRPRGGGDLPPGFSTIPCGLVRSVPGLAGLRQAVTVASQLASVATDDDGHPLELDGAWHRIARRLLEDSGIGLAAALDGALAAVKPAERDRLEGTVRSYLATGNVTTTAAELFCHRNTILNRLARFHELTGINLTVPAEAARVRVAWA